MFGPLLFSLKKKSQWKRQNEDHAMKYCSEDMTTLVIRTNFGNVYHVCYGELVAPY